MTLNELIHLRLLNQQLVGTTFKTPEQLAHYFCGLQAQDHYHGKWAIGIRLPNSTDVSIENAFADQSIVRTWLMRGTIHIVAAEDVVWLTDLVGAKVIASCASRYRNLELDIPTLNKCNDILVKYLHDNKELTRDELTVILNKHHITASGIRLAHILQYACYNKLICNGSRKSGENTYRLLDATLPKDKPQNRNEALIELAKRYFISRGPATVQDFVWWSGLSLGEAKKGLESVKTFLHKESFNSQEFWFSQNAVAAVPDQVFLLPGFDEYVLAYKDRSICLTSEHTKRVIQSNGIFNPTIIDNGYVIGTWKKVLKKEQVLIHTDLFQPISLVKTKAILHSAQQYARFLNKDLKN